MAKLAEEYLVNCDAAKAEFIRQVSALYDKHRYLTIKVSAGKQRTKPQNKSLHLYFKWLEIAFKEAGITMTDLIELPFVELDLSVDETFIKKKIWKPIQKALIDEESTAQAKRGDYTEVHDTVNRWTSDRFGISVPWPSKEK